MSPFRILALLASIAIFYAVSVGGQTTSSTTPSTTPHPTTKNESSHSTQKPTPPTKVSTSSSTPTPSPATKDSTTSDFPDNIVNWSYTNPSNNLTCIKLVGAIRIAFNYTDSHSKTNRISVDIPESTKENYTVTGSCGNITQTLSLTWASPLNKTLNNTLLFTFEKTTNNTKVSLKELAAELFVNDTSVLKQYSLSFENFTEFNSPVNSSFKCKSKLNFSGKTANSTLWFANLQYEAFRLTASKEFSNDFACAADSSSGGMSSGLMAFLIIVLIVAILGGVGLVFYFYKKIRSNATNAYENM